MFVCLLVYILLRTLTGTGRNNLKRIWKERRKGGKEIKDSKTEENHKAKSPGSRSALCTLLSSAHDR